MIERSPSSSSAPQAMDAPERVKPSSTVRQAAPVETGGFSWKYWAFRVAGAVAPVVPLWLARPLLVAGGWTAWGLARRLRRRAEWNMGHIPALAADPARRRRVARQAFVALALNYLDFFRGRRVTKEELERGWVIEGWDDLQRALALGKGVVVMGAHYGPYEYSAWMMGALGHPLITPAERLKPERLHQLVAIMRNHHNVRMTAGDERETLREMIAALRGGNMVVFAVDRWVMGPRSPWPFFGAPAQLPTAPFALAARSDAPVFFLAPRRAGPGRFTGVIQLLTPERMEPALANGANVQRERGESRSESRETAIARMRAIVYPAIERLIAEEPGQWVSALSKVWDAPPGPAGSASEANQPSL